MPSNEYMREYMNRRYHARRALAISTLGGKCARCPSQDGLEVDHIEHTLKGLDFAQMAAAGIPRFEAELAKCQLLCRVCHESKTRDDMGHDPKGAHGTLATYQKGGCRCDECRAANSAYQAAWRRAKKARLRATVEAC